MTDPVVVRLRMIAAKAEQLAMDYERNRLWQGDLARGLSEIDEQLKLAHSDTRRSQ